MGFLDMISKAYEDAKANDNGSELADGTELYMKQNSTFNESYDIVNADKQPVYKVKGNFTSHAFQLKTADGANVAEIKKKFIALSPSYTFSFTNGQNASLKKKMSLLKPEFNGTVNGKNLVLKGDLIKDSYEVFVNNQKIGAVAKKLFAASDTYVISFIDNSWKEIMVALVVALDNACYSESDSDS